MRVSKENRGQIKPSAVGIALVMITIAVIVLGVTLNYGIKKSNIVSDFCEGNSIKNHDFYYCDGKPYVCDLEGCNYINLEDTNFINYNSLESE